MTPLLDVSVSVHEGMPVWPGSTGVRLTRAMRLDAGDAANVTRLDLDVHAGTHVDAPLHFLPDGAAVDALLLDVLIGPAWVAVLSEADVITAETLNALSLPHPLERLLLRTRNSERWDDAFTPDYVGFTLDAAKWIVDHHVQLVGIDYMSIQRFAESDEVHRHLLRAGVVIVEGLQLRDVITGSYELICLPLKLAGAEGAPARAILRPLTEPSDDGS